ncbi:MAG: Bifunctional protein GlmU [Elusimicrobia bacterium]|nr:Bifunctional protein GlmU [Elusimicrobiota bacterium]
MKKDGIHLIIPMSGQGVRFVQGGYSMTKPLVPISGHPMIKRVLSQFPTEWPAVFVLSTEQKKSTLPKLLKELRPQGKILFVPPHKKGPGFALKKGLEAVPPHAPVLVSYCDYGMVWDSQQFQRFVFNSQCDGCVLSYRGFHAHLLNPAAYATSRMVGEQVVQIKEKGSFTDNRENEYTSCGAYYFKSAADLKRSLRYQIKKDLLLGGESYTSLTMEALLQWKKNADVRIFEIEAFFQWGTPEDVWDFEYWEKTFKNWVKNQIAKNHVAQVLMPMAGLGARFSAVTHTPKPFIPLNGKPLYENALDSLPDALDCVVVTTNEMKEFMTSTACRVVSLQKTPAGQALTVQEGANALDPSKEVVVSACDHAIVLSPKVWKTFHGNPQCDAAIFTVQGYPGTRRTPHSYSYVAIESSKEKFPRLKYVSLKKPVSDAPTRDHLLLGTFWFKSVDFMRASIRRLIEKGQPFNGEYYLDAVFDLIEQSGGRVRIVPVDGFICWGDPQAMKEARYWQEIYSGHHLHD